MNCAQMRVELKKQYGPSWAKKVDKMSDQQVTAVYIRMRQSGRIK